MSLQCCKRAPLTQIEKRADGVFSAVMYDARSLDRDGESIDFGNLRVREPVTAQIDHDHSVLSTVGLWSGIHTAGQQLRGTVTFMPPGISETADQVRRQVESGITSTISIGYLGEPAKAPDGHRVWTNIELLEASFVSVPASPGARVDQRALKAWLTGWDDDELVLELLDDDELVLEIADEPTERTYDIDEHDLARAIADVVQHAWAPLIRHAVQREMNLARGRVD